MTAKLLDIDRREWPRVAAVQAMAPGGAMATVPMALIHQHFVLAGRPADEALARRIAGQFFSAARPLG